MRSDSDGTKPVEQARTEASGDVGYLLFDSLVHQLIEKGLLTKNDALSIVQTAAEVVRGRIDDGETPSLHAREALDVLQRTYSSFEALRDRGNASRLDGENVHSLRPSLHADRPQFPSDD